MRGAIQKYQYRCIRSLLQSFIITAVTYRLTQEWIDEAIPHASRAPDEPPALRAGGEAERGAEDAHQQITHWDAHQKIVHGRAQQFVATEQDENERVVEKPESSDEPKAHGDHQVSGRTQIVFWVILIQVRAAPVISSGAQRATQTHVGLDHCTMNYGLGKWFKQFGFETRFCAL